MLPLFALWGPSFLFSSELQLLMTGRWPSVSYVRLMMMAFVGLMRLPEHVVVCVPLAATLKDLMREDRPTWTWVERAGLGAVLVTAVTEGIRIMAETTHNTPLVPEGLAYLSIRAVLWLAAFAVACIAVRRFGGFWKSWTEQQSPLTSSSRSNSATAELSLAVYSRSVTPRVEDGENTRLAGETEAQVNGKYRL